MSVIVQVQVAAGADDFGIRSYAAEGAGGTFENNLTEHLVGAFTGANRRSAGCRFTGITIPAGVTIVAAYLRFKSGSSENVNNCNWSIWANDVAIPVAPINVASYWGQVKTAAQVDWNAVGAWVLNTLYDSPSLVAIVQELVNSYAPYVAGAMQFILWNNASSNGALRRFLTWETAPASAPILHIEYDLPKKPGGSMANRLQLAHAL